MTSSNNIDSDDVQMKCVQYAKSKDLNDKTQSNKETCNVVEKPNNTNHIETKQSDQNIIENTKVHKIQK